MQYDILIIGAGLVGLATAWQLHRQAPDLRIAVVDKADRVAAHQSGHNSGVIHSGIYYPPGKTRALHCRRGYDLLLEFCQQYDIAYQLCGKLIVATRSEELPRLDNILARGKANGLIGLRRLAPAAYREIEPHAGGLAAIHVPQAGIADYPAVARQLRQLLIEAGQSIRLRTEVVGITSSTATTVVQTNQGDLPTRFLVNCAGLYSDKIAQLTGTGKADVQILPFRGEYYTLRPEREHLVKGLIYPVPDPAFPFLGVHFTRMVKGGVEAGPNAVLAFAREGYTKRDIDWSELRETLTFPGLQRMARQHWRFGWQEMRRSFSKREFWKSLRHLVPAIQSDDLLRGGAGVRAMACDRQGNMIDDFLFWERPGVLNVANAPSPAATACLAIGETISRRVLAQLTD